jgi:isocitrate lyase
MVKTKQEKQKTIERQVRWWKDSDPIEELQSYNVLIVNQPRMIELIKQRIRNQIYHTRRATVMAEERIDKGLIAGSGGLHYWLGIFETQTPDLDLVEAYKGKINKEDPRMMQGKNQSGWYNLIEEIVLGQV